MATQTTSSNTYAAPPLEAIERDTLPRLFFHAVDTYGRPDAMRYKAAGAWHTLSHREVETRVARLAAALAATGVERGDRVAILSENRPEWAITDYAALGLGAIDVPIYPTLPANQIAYILKDCSAKVVCLSNREQLEKILEIRDDLPDLVQVISFDDPGGAANVQHLDAVLERGRAEIEEGRARDFREMADAVDPEDVATLIYTSGTTGDPKGVMLTHLNLVSNVAATHQHDVLSAGPDDVALSFLPLSHVLERMVDYWYWDSGISIAYAESIDTVADNLMEVSPTVAVSVPRLFEKIYTRVVGATGVKKLLVGWAKGVGESFAEQRLAGETPSGGLAFRYRIADKLVFSKLRAKTGGRMKVFISGGAPLSADIAKFFFAAGLPIYEGYGLTETSPVLAVNTPSAVRLGTVGQPVPGTEIRISGEGEILARGPQVMKGYWNRPDATSEVFDPEGWFRTGDIGELDADGFLRITDRLKNIIVTAGGKNIAPQPIENRVAMSPFIAQVVMIGDKRAYPILLVVPDAENLAAWATQEGIARTDLEHLAKQPKVHELLEREAFDRLDEFARYERPKKVVIVPQEFTIESGMLTPSLKVKRRVVEEEYQDVIDAAYEE